MTHCIFCDILNGSAEATFIYRDELVSAFMDIQPITTGHVLIVPNYHAAYISDLDYKSAAQMFVVANKINEAIRRSELKSEGVNYFLADGAAAGQEIFHVHLHVFPRFKGDGMKIQVGDDYHRPKSRNELENAAKLIIAKMVEG